jgi:hypothetical protein
MAGLMESHVRPGLAKSEGAKHKTVAAAFSDIFDNARFHGEAFEGASHVEVTLGPQASPHLKVRSCRPGVSLRPVQPQSALQRAPDKALTTVDR